MKWTQSEPRLRGWYWFKGPIRPNPEIVLYEPTQNEQYYNDGDSDKVSCVIGYWSDKPIEKPENNL